MSASGSAWKRDDFRHRQGNNEHDSKSHATRRSRSPAQHRRRLSRQPSWDELPAPPTKEPSKTHSSSRRHRDPSARRADVLLPYSARPLLKTDFEKFQPLFEYYLNLQKQKELELMDEREARGRWKSFIGKWNRAELAEGWYDPEMYTRASERAAEPLPQNERISISPPVANERLATMQANNSDEDDYGPQLPGSATSRLVGARGPTLQDISLRQELGEESRAADRDALRVARKADRAQQKDHLDDILPRAEAGTRERKLEKKRETNEKMREFREKSPGVEASNEKELLGGDDTLEEYKSMKQKEQRRKSEREIRREEIDRAKREEMEERKKVWKDREDGTISMLRELARQRFG